MKIFNYYLLHITGIILIVLVVATLSMIYSTEDNKIVIEKQVVNDSDIDEVLEQIENR